MKVVKNQETYTKDEKDRIMNSLMYSPICPKDGKFKFDRELCNKQCFECCYDIIRHLN